MTAKKAAAARAKSSPNDFHLSSVAALQNANVPFLIGGAFVVEVYAGVSRRTKDFDLYIRPRHVDAALDALARAGYETEVTSPHWLAKAKRGRDYVDLIFRAGNGLCEVDDSWFERAHDHELLGLRVKLAAPEETIWMKAYIMERERFDGADVAHILSSCAEKLDWQHLVQRFGSDWRVLLSHFVLFGYIYPGEQGRIPMAPMDDLIWRLRKEEPVSGHKRSAAERCSRASNIWWTCKSGDFTMPGWKTACTWIPKILSNGRRRSRKRRKLFDELAWRSRWRRAQFSRNGRNHW
jgi:predicted nucleotidyltransferase